MYRFLGRSVLIAALAALMSVSVLAQKKAARWSCRDDNNWYGDKLVGNCEIREQTLAPSGAVAIDGEAEWRYLGQRLGPEPGARARQSSNRRADGAGSRRTCEAGQD
jgi:hypothetical protein